MTRAVLCSGLSMLALALGLVTCLVQSANHQRAHDLAELQREIEMLGAANAQMEATAAAHVWSLSDSLDAAAAVAGGASTEEARP